MQTELMNDIQKDIMKYDGIRMPLKASLPERMFIRKMKITKLHPNPDDEFCMPSIGPNYEIISDYVSRIRRGKYWAGGADDGITDGQRPCGLRKKGFPSGSST